MMGYLEVRQLLCNPANFATTGASVVLGRMIDAVPVGGDRGAIVTDMIGGFSVQGGACVVGCLGINQSLREGGGLGATAIEVGVGSPGVSGGAGVSQKIPITIPVGGNSGSKTK
jgi:hypothetical protein